MRNILSIALLFVIPDFFGMNAFADERACSGDKTIFSGKCIGNVCLSMHESSVKKILGKPIKRYRALPGSVSVGIWRSNSKRGAENLYVAFLNNKVVDVHTTSADFRTCSGISINSTFEEVTKAYPAAEEDEYTIFKSGKLRYDWIDKKAGITFTFSGNPVNDPDQHMIRLVIHRPGFYKSIGYSESDDLYWMPR